MEPRPLLLLLYTFYLISCANSAIIYNDESSEGEYVSRVLSRVLRSPTIWNRGDEKRSLVQRRDFLDEWQDGMRHENVIYITLAGNPESSRESSQDHEGFSLWNMLGKTTEFITPRMTKPFSPHMPRDRLSFLTRSKFDPPPYFPGDPPIQTP